MGSEIQFVPVQVQIAFGRLFATDKGLFQFIDPHVREGSS